jgi:hypothetical protein
LALAQAEIDRAAERYMMVMRLPYTHPERDLLRLDFDAVRRAVADRRRLCALLPEQESW